MTPEYAEILALEALAWLAGEPDAIDRFLKLSGLDVAELRAAAGTRGMAAAVLDFLLADEKLLLRFCEAGDGLPPGRILAARRALGGFPE